MSYVSNTSGWYRDGRRRPVAIGTAAEKRAANARKRYAERRAEGWRRSDSELRRVRQHDRKRFRRYGLTREQFDELFARQGGTCAFSTCERTELVVDHDHATGRIRGLLCRPHNLVADLVGDCLVEAAAYLGVDV